MRSILWTWIFLLVDTVISETFNCYTCTYTLSTDPTVDYECVRNPENVTKGLNHVTCQTPYQCVTRAAFSQGKRQVRSVTRTCLPPQEICSGDTCCNDAGVYPTCEHKCRGDMCNKLNAEMWIDTSPFKCYACMYSKINGGGSSLNFECVTRPANVTLGDYDMLCNYPHQCSTHATFTAGMRDILSVTRSCRPRPDDCWGDYCCTGVPGTRQVVCDQYCDGKQCNTVNPERWLSGTSHASRDDVRKTLVSLLTVSVIALCK